VSLGDVLFRAGLFCPGVLETLHGKGGPPERNTQHGLKRYIDYLHTFLCVYVGVMYSGEYDVCDVSLSMYPQRES
jgi:hypothetical protein